MLNSKATEGSDIGLKVFQEIGHHASNETGICGVKGDHKQCLTAGRIAKNLGLNRKTVGRWIDRIVESGELEILAQSAQKGAGAWRVFKVNVPFEDVPLIGTPKSDPLIEENSGNGTPKSDPLIEEMSHLQKKMGHLEELMGHLMGHMTELMGHQTQIMGHPSRGNASKYPEYPIDTKVSSIRERERVPNGTPPPSLSEPKSEKSSIRKTASMINMLSDVAKIPAEGNWVILEDLAKWLVSQEIEPAQIGKHYGRRDPGNGIWWWYRDFWKGKKGEYPEKPTDIRNTILKAVEFEPLPVQQVETKTTGKAADATQRAIAKLRAQAAA